MAAFKSVQSMEKCFLKDSRKAAYLFPEAVLEHVPVVEG
jgi:hypothetical protein